MNLMRHNSTQCAINERKPSVQAFALAGRVIG